MLSILKKKNGIDLDYYLKKLDRDDTMNALHAAELTKEELDWVFESDSKTSANKSYIEDVF